MNNRDPIEQMAPWFGDEEAAAAAEYIRAGGWMTEFRKTQELEQMIAGYVGCRHAVMVTSGTAALFCALTACGIGPGDEVLVPDITMIATANAVLLAGGKPVFVDISPIDWCMDLEAAERATNSRTKAMLLVSLNGRAPVMSRVLAFTARHSLKLIEDAAQSFGSFQGGKHLGTFGDAGIFSFSPLKIITTGQGGAVVTDDAETARRVRQFKDFGRAKGGQDHHDFIGYNFKFTDLQAVIGIEQMKKLPHRVERKKAMFEQYRSELAGVAGLHFLATDLSETTPWFMDILADRRDALQVHLNNAGIKSRPFYPPVHSQPPYRAPGTFPVTEDVAARGLWLPSSAFLAGSDVRRVCEAVRDFR
jgi:perosamine synthetase